MSYGVHLMILDQSLLQPLKHFGRAKRESVEPNQSNKHETHPSSIGGLSAPQRLTKYHEIHPELRV